MIEVDRDWLVFASVCTPHALAVCLNVGDSTRSVKLPAARLLDGAANLERAADGSAIVAVPAHGWAVATLFDDNADQTQPKVPL